MTAAMALPLIAGAVAGGFVNGLAGMGTALFALAFYLMVLDPVTAVAVVALMSVITGVQGLWVVRSAIHANPVRLARFIVPGLVGVPLGIVLLWSIDALTLRLGIAVFLVVYGAYFSFRAALPRFERHTPFLDGVVGFMGGVMGGAASLSGALPTMFLSLRPWPRSETRAVLQPFNVVILMVTVVVLAGRGAYQGAAIPALLLTVPISLVAAQAGIFVFRRISDDMFRRLLIGLTLVLGVGILLQEIL